MEKLTKEELKETRNAQNKTIMDNLKFIDKCLEEEELEGTTQNFEKIRIATVVIIGTLLRKKNYLQYKDLFDAWLQEENYRWIENSSDGSIPDAKVTIMKI